MNLVHPKIRQEHLNRRAVVYVRQSSLRQVKENLESQRLQYALADRARKMGWNDVEIIDSDLGSSASAGSDRTGFNCLVASVALGEVGIIFSREASRLSRTDKDWCHLLEVCQAYSTLIADEEQVYDLDLIDDQLVLGIKGTMSVVELKILKMRMYQGRLEKARRGEYLVRLPPGYVLDGGGNVVKDPDERVREAIDLIFRKFRELWSARQTCLWFRDNNVKVPVNRTTGKGVNIVWILPKASFTHDVLANPFYAGAYTYGRGVTKLEFKDGALVKRRTRPDRWPETCQVFIRDHHVGYITWETFEENRERMRRNQISAGSDPRVAAVRAGKGLLAGLLRCGHCGRKLHIRYWGRSGTSARYFCDGDYTEGGTYCIAFGGFKVDRRISDEILKVISPLGLDASLEAIKSMRSSQNVVLQSRRLELEQIDYDVQRAFDQYNQVDPRNRLVAAELERRWNDKIEEREKLRSVVAQFEARNQRSLSPDQESRLLYLGENFADVWEDETCPIEMKKKIVHTLIEEILVSIKGDKNDEIHFIIHWKGGTHTHVEMPKPLPAEGQRTSKDSIDIIGKLAVRYGDDQIAAVLNKLGHVTGKGLRWTRTRVATARHTHKIVGRAKTEPDPEVLSVPRAANYCDVPRSVIVRLVREGHVANGQDIPMAPWELRRSDLDSEPIQEILDRYRRTGKYPRKRGCAPGQMILND